ncbi:DUF3253 domain-containing protein [Haloferula sp.]|uniref:DUF3253 domain-containing protein n=1 Tax=Haloferula sp. TaxID=2497595 RepID=UPI003C7452BD
MKLVKSCACCGREIEWRKKWQNCWDEIRYCSEKCRRQRVTSKDQQLEATIIGILESRASGKTICPSEAARKCFGEDSWRPEMERTRQAARRLVATGKIEIVQQGHTVDPSTAKGPIRLRRGPDFS